MTHQRDVIIDELRKAKDHPTADDLFKRVKKRLPHLGLSTVYRNLKTLSKSGMIQQLEISGHQKCYDWNTEPHDHIICTICQRIEDVEFDKVKKQSLISGHDKGYEIADCRIEMSGVCPECQENSG